MSVRRAAWTATRHAAAFCVGSTAFAGPKGFAGDHGEIATSARPVNAASEKEAKRLAPKEGLFREIP